MSTLLSGWHSWLASLAFRWRPGRIATPWRWVLFGVVALEVLMLLLNGRRCPLTAIAARYTNDCSPNFDIYLPVWLARHNQLIFGALYLAGSAYALLRWMLMAV